MLHLLSLIKYTPMKIIIFPIGLVFGSENEGISKFWEENSDEKIKIPMGNKIDSLNVSVSCAIILYEINRQSKFKL